MSAPDHDEGVLQHEWRRRAGTRRSASLRRRLEPPGGTRRPAAGRRPRRVLRRRPDVGVLVELAAADVLVGEVAADEALLRFACRRCAGRGRATAGTGTARPRPLRMLPDEEAGAADVVRVGEADEQAVAVGRVSEPGPRDRAASACSGALADAARRSNSFIRIVDARVAAGVAVLDAPRDLVGGERLRRRGRRSRRPTITRAASARRNIRSPDRIV